MVSETTKRSQDDWVQQTATMAELCGYRPIPYYKSIGKPSPYAAGQRYTADDPKWATADFVAIALDNVVLVDWDAYKDQVISIAELAVKLGISEVELRGAEVQNDPKKDSKHFFFRLPDGFDSSQIMDSNNGNFIRGIDFKTGNQLAYLKPHKELRNDMLPFTNSLPLVPDIVINEILKRKESNVVPIGEVRQCINEDVQAAKWLDEDCLTLANLSENRNTTLNDMVLKHGKRAAGGLLDIETVKQKLMAAYLASGKDKSTFNATWRSAIRKAQIEPVNTLGNLPNPSKVFGNSIIPSDNEDYISLHDALIPLCKAKTYGSLSEVEPAVVQIFNRNHSVLMNGGKTVIAERKPDHKGNIGYEFASVPQVKEFLRNLNITYMDGDKPKQSNCLNMWLRSFERRTYQGLVFDPSGKTKDNFLNLWDGFGIEPVPGDDQLDLIMWHLRNIICSGNEEHFYYLLAWLAQIIQQPDKKTGVALVLRSDARGTGKSTISKIMEQILKHHAFRIQDGKHLLGAFNAHLANKLFITIEEAFWAGNPKDAGKLKTMVTESTMVMEGKGRDAISIDSHHRFLMCTNDAWVVPASESERRWFVLDVSEEKKQNKDYFNDLYRDIEDERCIGQFFNFLLNYDISSFDLRKAPSTEAMQEQIMLSLPSEANWLMAVLDDGYVCDGTLTFHLDEPQNVPKRAFRDSYLSYCKENQTPSYDVKKDAVLGKYLKTVLKLTDGPRCNFPQLNARLTTIQTKSLVEMQILFEEHYKYR